MFVKYITISQHRRKVSGLTSLIEGIDINKALNDDFKDDIDEDDDVEERRLHY